MASFSDLNLATVPGNKASTDGSSSIRITPSTTVATDIWRKPGPPVVDTFNAPVWYQQLPLREFKSVQVTVSAAWNTLYDQGGLVLILPPAPGTSDERRWVKTGIEFYNGSPYVSTVACDRWADWSLVDAGIREVQVDGPDGAKATGHAVELKLERKEDDDTLWVYVLDGDRKIPVREVTWALSENVVGGGPDREVWVGMYAATPKGMELGPRSELEVKFEGFELAHK